MEEDIKIIKNHYVFTTNHVLDDENKRFKKAIENLINKYKEQEKIIELMKEYIFKEYISPEICSKHTAEDCYADIYDENACRECIIDYFKKKAREENETN